MHRTRLVSGVVALVVGGTYLFGPADARANGYYRIPASACQPAKADVGSVSPSSRGVYNDRTSGASKVYCPVTFDGLNLWTTPDRTVQIAIYYTDLNPSADVWCTLNMLDSDSNLLVTSTQISFATSTRPQSFVWTLDMNVIDRGSRSANWSITCTIPPTASGARSQINSYLVLAL